MDKKTGIIIASIIAAFAVLIGVSVAQGRSATEKKPSTSVEEITYDMYERAKIADLAEKINLDNIDPNTVLKGSPDSGNLPDNYKGDPSKAKIVIFEYADYQCAHCAERNPEVNELLETYKGKLAIVFRNYVLSYDPLGVQAGSAVQAAAIQGYWSEYKDLVFANQGDWYNSKRAKFQEQLEAYFVAASKGKGDLEKFREDMKSEAVARKLAMDMALAEKMDLQGTPAFYLDGQLIKITDLKKTIEDRLK